MSVRPLFFRGFELLYSLVLAAASVAASADNTSILIRADRIFDGYAIQSDSEILLNGGKVVKIGRRGEIRDETAKIFDLGNATLLPGFIDLHGHLSFQHVPAETVLRHGITTLRDVGGPLHPPRGGDGELRLLTSGPILTAPDGYPIPNLGEQDIAIPIDDEREARETVRKLVDGGAVLIKIALEPGNEAGAPWSGGGHNHAHAHGHRPSAKSNWPLLPLNLVKAIVDEAHKLNRRVSAHLAEAQGAEIALNAGVDEWAHTPCAALSDQQLQRAVAQQVKIVSTIDTLSKCPGIESNVKRLAALGAEFLYGAEIAHPDIPWGIDGQELLYLQHWAGMDSLDIMRTATSTAGQYLNLPLLGTLLPGAPADLIAVKGDPTQQLKLLEYPQLVVSGGKIVVDQFSHSVY